MRQQYAQHLWMIFAFPIFIVIGVLGILFDFLILCGFLQEGYFEVHDFFARKRHVA